MIPSYRQPRERERLSFLSFNFILRSLSYDSNLYTENNRNRIDVEGLIPK